MDTELLVDNRIEDGRKLIVELVRDGFDVVVALWLKTSEEGLWFLYIASTSVETERIGDAYRRVYSCLSRIADPCVALSETKLIHAMNPIAQDAIAVRDRYPGKMPTKYQGRRLGNLSIEEAYIYPPASGPMTRNEVLQTAVGLMNRAGIPQPSTFTLRDGSEIHAIPVSIDRQSSGTISIVLQDVVASKSQVVSADDVASIQ